MSSCDFIHVCFFSNLLQKGFGVFSRNGTVDVRKVGFHSLQGMTTWEIGRSDEVEEGKFEMEQSKENTLLGRVSGEKLEQVFYHDSALAIEITVECVLRW